MLIFQKINCKRWRFLKKNSGQKCTGLELGRRDAVKWGSEPFELFQFQILYFCKSATIVAGSSNQHFSTSLFFSLEPISEPKSQKFRMFSKWNLRAPHSKFLASRPFLVKIIAPPGISSEEPVNFILAKILGQKLPEPKKGTYGTILIAGPSNKCYRFGEIHTPIKWFPALQLFNEKCLN